MNSKTESNSLLGAADIRRIADQIGIHPTKRLGQNFVIDPGTVRRIVRLAGVESGQTVLEVGPGLGSLTLGLLEAGCLVTADEIDPVLAQQLPQTVRERMPESLERLTVINRDALTLTPQLAGAMSSGQPPTWTRPWSPSPGTRMDADAGMKEREPRSSP